MDPDLAEIRAEPSLEKMPGRGIEFLARGPRDRNRKVIDKRLAPARAEGPGEFAANNIFGGPVGLPFGSALGP